LKSGATMKVGSYMPQRLELKAEKPSELAKAPELSAPMFGILTMGTQESPTRAIVAVDEPEGQPARLYVDANGNGDLTDDPATEWQPRTSRGSDGKELTMYLGGASVELPLGGPPVPAR